MQTPIEVCYLDRPVSPVPRRRRWIDLLTAGLLILLLPACWSWALLESGSVSASSTPGGDDGGDGGEGKSEGEGEGGEAGQESTPREIQGGAQLARHGARPTVPPPAALTAAPWQRPALHCVPARLASADPKPHPLRFSVRRQR